MRIRQTLARSIYAGLGAVMLAIGLTPIAPARAADQVDLELVLAIDVSRPMDGDEQEVARRGHVAAFRDPEVIQGILAGISRKIAVTYVEWSDPGVQTVVVPWTIIDSAASANAFADALQKAPLQWLRSTSMSDALLFSANLFDKAGVTSPRRTIDVSGNGPNNAGVPVTQARDSVAAKGITINGLPIDLGPREAVITNLSDYYRQCVIGGPEAFLVSINQLSQLPSAIRRKLLAEIASIDVPQVIHAQAGAPVDCMIGEKIGTRFR